MKYRFSPSVHFRSLKNKILHLIFLNRDLYLNIDQFGSFFESDVESLSGDGLKLRPENEAWLKHFADKGLVEVADQTFKAPSEIAFLQSLSINSFSYIKSLQKLRESRILILCCAEYNGIISKAFSILKNYAHQVVIENDFHQIRQSATEGSNTIVLFFLDKFEEQAIEATNKYFLEKKVPWILVSNYLNTVSFGPVFNQTNNKKHCYQCFNLRYYSNNHEHFHQHKPENSIINDLNLQWIETQMLIFYFDMMYDINRKLVSFNPLKNSILVHNYLPAPVCEVCRP